MRLRHLAIVVSAVLLGTLSAATAHADPQPSKAAVPGPTAKPKLPVRAKAVFNPADAKNRWGSDRTGSAAMINGFKADGHGLGVLYWTLRNDSAGSIGPGSFTSNRWGTDIVAPSGVNILDDKQRHATLLNPKSCLCYINPPGIEFSRLDKGEEIPLAQVFVVSPTATRVTVEIPGFQPVRDIPVER